MKTLVISILAAIILPMSAIAGELRFASLIGDNMVLQQSSDVRIWGFAEPKAQVQVSASWSQTPVVTKADAKGKWEVSIATPSGSFVQQTVTASSAGKSVTASNVLIGEVWFCSGQSNMEMSLGGGNGTPVEGSLEEVAMSGQYKGVRHFTISKVSSLEPADDVKGEWMVSNPTNSPRFSAVAYFFASRLSKALDVPVGVINASWGGSVIAAWMSRESLAKYPGVNLSDAEDSKVNAMYKPYIMYNGMFKPASRYTVKGILWYQGESNICIMNEEYAALLETMASTWRSDFGLGDIPFLIVELPPYDYYDGEYGLQDEKSPLLREQQFLASKAIPNAGIIGTNDLAYPAELNQVHPSQKRQVGERACYMAMNMAYGYSSLPAFSPSARAAYVDGPQVSVYFDNARDGFLLNDGINGFEIAGEGGNFHPADAKVKSSFFEGSSVVLTSRMVPEPRYVRYCYRDFQAGTLKGANGLPVIPFSMELKPISEKPAPQRPQMMRRSN